ncbi:MAG TPA: acetate/propionate family kinase [Candidatus Limnocylindria bacterium]|nr:acetate/propionate family kinase [Candidatus Limnocylindria bacterium]
MRVLVLNPGSSTLKAAVVDSGTSIADAVVEWPADAEDASGVVGSVLERLPNGVDAVGYRVVHGGGDYRSATGIDERLLARVDALDELAPLHNRRAVAVMRVGSATLRDVPHVACFDTAFHASLEEPAWRYALPVQWVERWGIRRFGFHGLSVAWSVRRAAELLAKDASELRLVVAHLGSGCSVTAVDGGRSAWTSMGYTPYEGPMMGTRSGSVDPGILIRLMRAGTSTDDLADGLAHSSGLLAIAGTSDAREVERRAERGDAAARLALAMFGRQVAASIASAATALPAMDGLVFTGGIGEHSAAFRGAILGRLGILGVPDSNAPTDGDTVVAPGPPATLVIEAREELVIAGEVEDLLHSAAPSS